jgi:transcriptional regulator with XRE-family HTH domain
MTGKWLKAVREEMGLSQEKMAEILEVQRVTISRAENKAKVPRMLDSLIRLAIREGRLKLPYQAEAADRQATSEEFVVREEPPEGELPKQKRRGPRP